MKKLLTRIAVALLTFSLGMLVASLFHSRSSRSRPEERSAQPVIISTQSISKPVKWRRIIIGRVSFSIPADLRKTGPPGNIGVVQAYGGPFVGQWDFYLYYSHGREVGSDYNVPRGTLTNLIIDGKPAKLYVVGFDERMYMSWKDRPEMHLVIADVGDGRTKFEIYASSFDEDLMNEIMHSVSIR